MAKLTDQYNARNVEFASDRIRGRETMRLSDVVDDNFCKASGNLPLIPRKRITEACGASDHPHIVNTVQFALLQHDCQDVDFKLVIRGTATVVVVAAAAAAADDDDHASILAVKCRRVMLLVLRCEMDSFVG